MNGTNKRIVGAVYGVALAYTAAAFVFTVLSFEGDAGTVLPGIAKIHGPYSAFVAPLSVNFALALAGIALAVAGMFTREPLDVLGRTNPAQYLWTHRPNAFLRCLGAPWGLITSHWKDSKALSVLAILLLPLYAVWSAIITLALVLPFAVAWLIVSWMVSSAVKKERQVYRRDTGFGVCPRCKLDFARPLVECSCGLLLEYPVPGVHGIRTVTCNNGHDLSCLAGRRSELATVCPHCKERIETQESHPICIALAGPRGSGKTSLMLAGVDDIMERAGRAGIASEASGDGISEEARRLMGCTAATVAGETDSQCLFLRPINEHGTEIVINDISGSEFRPSVSKQLFEEYYRYVDGVAFVIDPTRIGTRNGPDVLEAFNSFYGMFTQIRGAMPGTAFGVRLAVVATRRDETGLEDEDVRGHMVEKGAEPFVRTAEALFKEVRYFSTSPSGRLSRTSAEPFVWIMEGSDEGLARSLGAGGSGT